MRTLILALGIWLALAGAAEASKIIIIREKPKPAPRPSRWCRRRFTFPVRPIGIRSGLARRGQRWSDCWASRPGWRSSSGKRSGFTTTRPSRSARDALSRGVCTIAPCHVNVGEAKPGAAPAKVGRTLEQLVAAKGTPTTVVVQGTLYLWFYGTQEYVLRDGKVAPSDVISQMETAANKEAATSPRGASGGGAKGKGCYCPL